ncbi:MAG: DNA polymerase ligase N-terminal domain-containing protein [Rhodospirillales bacterium]
MARGSLKQYWKKRDFKVTAEPRGTVAKAATKKKSEVPFARFTVQKHDASRLHFDLRLEIDGVYKSWAVPKGPSLDPADKRLAVEVEDHPLDYGTFEGTIPDGQYGGGTVQLWDQGVFAALGDSLEGLRKGELKFATMGKRMKGGWVLVWLHPRRGERSGKPNWLLIKERDKEVRTGKAADIASIDKSVKTGRKMQQIASDASSPVWNSNRADAKDPVGKKAAKKPAKTKAVEKAAKKKTARKKPAKRKAA